LEKDRWSEFAADAYARGFLRSYGSFLGLDTTQLLAHYESQQGRTPGVEPAQEVWEPAVEAVQPAPVRQRRQLSRRTRIMLGVAASVAVFAGVAFLLAQRGVLELRPAAGL